MVKAVRGDREIKVSRKAYESMFKNRGYVLVEEGLATEQVEETEEVETEAETKVDEIPISEMRKEQLMEFAKQNDIDTSSARTTAEARKIIQKEVRRRNMQ